MKAKKIVVAVFTGTGNSLIAANALADAFAGEGKQTAIIPMERPEALENAGFDSDAALGLVVPVACFTTYPTAWRFIDALPEGNGREAFFLATMGGMGGGMQGPIGRVLRRKGYVPAGARFIKMVGNYGDTMEHGDALDAVYAHSKKQADDFCRQLLAGQGKWDCGRLNLVATFFAWLGRRRTSFKGFRRFFHLVVDKEKCTDCGICARQCPEKAIAMRDGIAEIVGECQSCQRCIGYCPAEAFGVQGKRMRQYRAVPPGDLAAFLGAGQEERG